jgi:murein DD-endopeptidase MepM/ murein hydrolase activator NlpD
MQITILSKSRKKTLSITAGPVSLAICLIVVAILGITLFNTGANYALNSTKQSISAMYEQTAPIWNREIKVQRATLSEARENAEKNLDALSTRLSKLQGHIMRLDALGSRLAQMAGLDDIKFDVLNPPGMGGPSPSGVQESLEVTDFLRALEELSVKIEDRGEKLAAMESMLIDHKLQDQTIPAGIPVLGGWISSRFGLRTDPISGKKDHHEGIDYAGRPGSPVIAVASGIVTWSGRRYGFGNLVEISHGSGYHTRYAHNKKNLVMVGEKVEKGQAIAVMGSSGRSTGTHVHFEVVHNGKQVNPNSYIKAN